MKNRKQFHSIEELPDIFDGLLNGGPMWNQVDSFMKHVKIEELFYRSLSEIIGFKVKKANQYGLVIEFSLPTECFSVTLAVEEDNKERTRKGIAEELIVNFLSEWDYQDELNRDDVFQNSCIYRGVAKRILEKDEWKSTKLGHISRRIYRFFKSGEFERRNEKFRNKKIRRVVKGALNKIRNFGCDVGEMERALKEIISEELIKK